MFQCVKATFGYFLQDLLNDLGISPTGLAAMMGRTERTVYNWLQSAGAPRDAVALLSDVLEIPPADLRRAAAGEQELAAQYRDRRRWKAARARTLRGDAAEGDDFLLGDPPPAPGRRVGTDPLAYLRKRGIEVDGLLGPAGGAADGPPGTSSGRGPSHSPAGAGSVGSAANYDARIEPHEDGVSAFESVGAGSLGARDVEQLSAALGEAGRFKVRLRGQSMAPDYPDGCWVVFSRPRAMAEGVVDNKDYLVWTTADESTFKRVVRDPADPGQYLLLRPLNPDRHQYPDQRIHRRDVAYVARAVRKEIEIL